VTYTYNRSLLDDIDELEVLACLEDISREISSNRDISPEVQEALQGRLKFRVNFLYTVSIADHRDQSVLRESWSNMLDALPGVSVSKDVGIPVSESFSVKLQRKLASSVPPRPVVSVAFQTAYEHLERLCRDGQVLTGILEYHDSQSLMVGV
jgi:hypothetical protein